MNETDTEPPIDYTEGATEAVEIAPVTLEQLVVSFGIGCIFLTVTLFLFAAAVWLRITHVAPRCEARPRDVIYNPHRHTCDASQNRGNPFCLGWLVWSLQLSYHTMIEGVPGTGTRKGGVTGHMLNVNLDGIVLLRFHGMALRIATFAMFVYCCICLPIYRTARCFNNPYQQDDTLNQNCTIDTQYNLTRYEQLTLANVPSLNEVHAWDVNAPIVTFRLYMVVLCTYVVCWYTCYELHKEWIDLLAMRRVYYLEKDHWKRRRQELQATMLQAQQGEAKHQHNTDCDNPHLHQREAWIPHPEQRDTPPSIELYSVLVGGLPKRPQQAVSDEDLEAALSDGDRAMDWQLSVTSAFFDYCVPNQPGYSSSVAAVTILPSASELAVAWKKWYIAAGKLQRLRFIRRTLLERGHGEEGPEEEENEDEGSPETTTRDNDEDVYQQTSSRRARYTNEILGYSTDEDVEAMFLKSLQMGPEQTAVYSMELAKGSSKCCPYGCCEERIRWSNTKTLLEMEEQAVRKAYDAFIDLEFARQKAAIHDQSEDSKCKPRPSVFWFEPSEAVSTSKKGESVETKLYGKGQAALEAATMEHQKAKEKRRSTYANGHVVENNPQNGMETNSSSESNSMQPGLLASKNYGTVRPRLETEGSSYFPSLLQPPNLDADAGRPKGVAVSRTSNDNAPHPWELVTRVATESEIGASETGHVLNHHRVSDGIWQAPSPTNLWNEFWKQTCSLFVWTVKTSDLATDLMARDTSFAVVTFTSRQAAIAARKCLADGRGAGRFRTIDNLPVPPLADASAFNICDCRGCCRPVTVTLNDHQKIWRNYVALIAVTVIYIGYTYPITLSATFGSQQARRFIPSLSLNSDELFGFIRAQLLNLFLALCPHMFLAIANFGSNATSMVEAEFSALQYYWWFFLLFALLGSSILQMVLRSFEEGSFNFRGTLQSVASTIPSQVSSNWTNWIILKATIFHPLSYLLQIQAFLLTALRLKCCARLVRGGGVGNRVPYRWYVESGMVLMFVLALAPAAPILAPFAVLYFIICNPILRWILIFTYKPQFDAGGVRFPFLFEMAISSMLIAQILMGMMMVLKNAGGPAVVAMLLAIPTLIFRRTCHKRFLGAYQDAALLQTSLLDGWDTSEQASTKTVEGREEFRQFLVDAHKAAYVPVCIAGTNTDQILTAEPAVAVPAQTDSNYSEFSSSQLPPLVITKVSSTQSEPISTRREHFQSMGSQQFGALMRRGNISSSGVAPDGNGTHLLPQVEDAESVPVKLSSLGLIREGLDGEMYIVDNFETDKDK